MRSSLLAARREHDDRRALRAAQQAAELEAVRSRQHDIEHDEVRREIPCGRDREIAVVHGLDVETFEHQVVREHAGQADVVLDDENASLHRVPLS